MGIYPHFFSIFLFLSFSCLLDIKRGQSQKLALFPWPNTQTFLHFASHSPSLYIPLIYQVREKEVAPSLPVFTSIFKFRPRKISSNIHTHLNLNLWPKMYWIIHQFYRHKWGGGTATSFKGKNESITLFKEVKEYVVSQIHITHSSISTCCELYLISI